MSEEENAETLPTTDKEPTKEEDDEDSESDDADVSEDMSAEEELTTSREELVGKLQEEKIKVEPRKRHKEDFDWDEDVIGNGAFGEVHKKTKKKTSNSLINVKKTKKG